ncbi:UDP-Gal or UDP-GlcNAc-dependent glycosyltransferase [Trypanosoma theileri]|uniref:Hexosyltransferase n=1 Tax=Trypanosoma theileri TaxID=67003 RepID=A0A1X0NPX4_9TRYP|nr:UDP-Gal or UDP-GlcNAc-dependent glycosyltransferase [Trypanosoma theileri]ORC86737.1 UDP-Gal or UDP-GlcNAc-dependent glycosyltransferase [Trypanosoma theileri]
MATRGPRKVVIAITLFFFLLTLQAFIGHRYYDADTAVTSSGYPSDTSLNVTAAVKPHSPDATADNESLRYIPHSTIQTWRERDYLIVFGIPSIDIEARRRRRYLQRTTCWQFPGVARRANNFTGAMLVLYVLARHPSHGYKHSAALLEEADEYHDIITLPMNDALPTTNKTIGGAGHWGTEAGISMSRKTYFWFELALRVFPNVSYISKGDDDMFLRVPQFLTDLNVLPLKNIYFGLPIGGSLLINNSIVGFRFASGMCYTLSRDVAEQFVAFEPLRRLVQLRYSKNRESEFFSLNMNAEDVMVARVLLVELQYKPLVFAGVLPCRFHNIRNDTGHFMVNRNSVVVHHLREDEYAMLMDRFGYIAAYTPKVQKLRKRQFLRFLC